MTQKKIIFIAVIIFILGVLLRFYQLGVIPGSLNWDEVSWGYNAYSIGKTAHDEHGAFLPLSFKAFGDFKQPVYVYLDVLPVLFFGLTSFAVRFPSALFGSLTVISVFLLTRELFEKDKYKDALSLLTMLLFAISPWSIQFSRVAFEANVGVFFTITGAWLFLFGLRRKNLLLLSLSAIVLSLSCFTYHSQKLFTPFLFIVLLFYGRKFFLSKRKALLLLLVIFFLANIIWAADARTTNRGRSVMFTSSQTEVLKDSTAKLIEDQKNHDVIGEVLHNRRVVYLSKYFENYLSHFSPNYLFIKGDNPRHHPPLMGDEYLVSLPFILLGIVLLLRKKREQAFLLIPWLLLAPVASSLAIDAPNASRSMVFLPTWDVFAALGIFSFVSHFGKKKMLLFFCVVAALYTANFVYYVHNYFSHTDFLTAPSWQYGYKEAVMYAKSVPQGKHVFFAPDVEQPYIFYLFYTKTDPSFYISTGGSDRISQPCFSINNAYFGRCQARMGSGDSYITAYDTTPVPMILRNKIYYPDGSTALRIYQIK